MKTYQVRHKVTNRTLTVELPEEFAGSEVKVVRLSDVDSDDTEERRAGKWDSLRWAKGIAKPSCYELTEDEWYRQ